MTSYMKWFLFVLVIILIINGNYVNAKEEEEEKDNTLISNIWNYGLNFAWNLKNALFPNCLPGSAICSDNPDKCCLCPEGTYSLIGKFCLVCGEGYYANKKGSVFCDKCPDGTWSKEGASNCYQLNYMTKAAYHYN